MYLVLSTNDLAKYPFVPDAAEYVKGRDLRIENLLNPDYQEILERAENRIEEALSTNPPIVSYIEREDDIEISSFPVAVVLAAASSSDYIKHRYALAEARRTHELIENEKKNEKILDLAKTFYWKLRVPQEKFGGSIFEFALYFTDFLKNAETFHEKEWKLVNRPLLNGEVYLDRRDLARLFQEEVKRHIERKLEANVRSMIPETILNHVERLKQKYVSKERSTFTDEMPEEIINEAFPTCVKQLYEVAKSGGHLSHIGRFTLTSFLLRAGMKPNEVVNLFRSSSDFNERMTRYQVEHIAGGRGSRTKYVPPKCETLQTHGVCPSVEESCRGVRHPLGYYLRKTRNLKNKTPVTEM